MQTPSYLKPGDKIGIISTARKISKEKIDQAIRVFKDWGLQVELGKHLFSEDHQYAGMDDQRAADLQSMLDDENIRAIICARGGYGTVRIIDRIDFSRFITNPKWIVGYSDVTVLHSHIHSNFSIETMHGIMPLNFPDPPRGSEAILSLRKALFGEPISYRPEPHPFNRKGTCKGMVVGGNLSILYSINSTTSDINTKNKILFIEDLDEYLYHIDRMMMNLKRSGKLSNLAGLIIGGMTEMNDNEVPFGKTAYEIIAESVIEYSYPVCFGFPAGHILDNRVLIVGREAEILVDDAVSLVFIP
ncbi:MAG: LD-carboxypeptidase [Bacteroidetes bacterium]|nr:LD-carboxypeptidase [Bacteroidota bacterium]